MSTKRQLERHNAAMSDNIVRLRAERDKAREETQSVHGRINELALAHEPVLWLVHGAGSLPVMRESGPTQVGSVFTCERLELKCKAKNCGYMWPCPTYLWATESEPFTLAVLPKTT
jgi:hypothetical protein